MATFNKIADDAATTEKAANIGTDSFVLALSNTAPGSESSNPTADGNGVLANVTQVSYTNCSSRALTTASSSQTSGTLKLDFSDITLTASGGSVGPFRYVYIIVPMTRGHAPPIRWLVTTITAAPLLWRLGKRWPLPLA